MAQVTYDFNTGKVRGVSGNTNTALGQRGLQQMANENPELADQTMDRLGYSGSPNTVLNSQTLGGDERAFNVSPGVPSISANGFGAEITGLANGETEIAKEEDALIRETTKEAKKDEGFLRRSKDSLMKAMGLQQTDTEILDQANSFKNEFGTTVNSTSKKLKEVNTKINAIDIRLNEQIKQLEKNSAGMFGGALQDKKDELTRQAASDKADLYIEKLIAQDDYDTARNIADRKVDMVLERQKLNLEKLRFDYEENKELFTKSEQRAFELAQGDRERKLNEESAARKEFEKLKIELAKSAAAQGAPQAVKDAIARAKDANQAIDAAGIYSGDILDRQYKLGQIEKLNAEIVETRGGTSVNLQRTDENGNPLPPTAADQALQVILGSGKFTKDQKASVINAINNGEDPFVVIRNQAKNIMGQTLATSLDKYETAKAQMENIQGLLTEYYAAGGKTSIFTGSVEKTINKLGEVSDPNLVDIATNISSALQIYRNAVSGTAYSVQEGKDIASIFPGINKSQGLNEAILAGRMKAFDTTIDASYRNTLGKAYDSLKSGNSSGATGKGQQSDRDFVAAALDRQGINYQEVVDATPPGQVPVIDNATGEVGHIPPSEFSASKYTKL